MHISIPRWSKFNGNRPYPQDHGYGHEYPENDLLAGDRYPQAQIKEEYADPIETVIEYRRQQKRVQKLENGIAHQDRKGGIKGLGPSQQRKTHQKCVQEDIKDKTKPGDPMKYPRPHAGGVPDLTSVSELE